MRSILPFFLLDFHIGGEFEIHYAVGDVYVEARLHESNMFERRVDISVPIGLDVAREIICFVLHMIRKARRTDNISCSVTQFRLNDFIAKVFQSEHACIRYWLLWWLPVSDKRIELYRVVAERITELSKAEIFTHGSHERLKKGVCHGALHGDDESIFIFWIVYDQ